jgi:hypothetical protein
VASIKEKYAGRAPLVFGDAELYGPTARADHDGDEALNECVLACSSKNLLGSGAMVLLDPEECEDRVGKYSLLFFSLDDDSEPSRNFTIGPKMMLKRVQEEEDGPTACFEFACPGKKDHRIVFNDLDIALAFARDFRVRARLLDHEDVSLKTAHNQAQVREARGKIEELRRHSFAVRWFRFFFFVLIALMVGVVIRIGILYTSDKGLPIVGHVSIVAKEAFDILKFLRSLFSKAGSQACEFAFGTVSLAQLQKCAELGGMSKVNDCINQLLASSSVSMPPM